jgi:hypothetical protein
MSTMMIASQVHPPSTGTCTPPRVMTADVSIALTKGILVLTPSLFQWQREVSIPANRESCQQRTYVSYLMSSFRKGELDLLTGSHVKLDTLVDTQGPFSDSHHKLAFPYDEDTVSLVKEQTLSTLDLSLSNNSNSSAGNASTAFEYKCYEIEADTP